MTPLLVVLLVSPFLAASLVLTVVVVTAIVRARREDIPAVVRVFADAFNGLAVRLPSRKGPSPIHSSLTTTDEALAEPSPDVTLGGREADQ